jgi:hypothetical protein
MSVFHGISHVSGLNIPVLFIFLSEMLGMSCVGSSPFVGLNARFPFLFSVRFLGASFSIFSAKFLNTS